MISLGIETSVRPGSVALCRDGLLLAERPLEQRGRRHAQTLVAEIDRLLRDFDLRAADCNLVAVSRGPGSFTGLRVGIVCAKTLAYAAGCRLAAVDTYQAVAENSPDDVDEVWVIGDAQRGELFVGHYRREDGDWKSAGEISIHNATEWCAQRSAGDVVSGPGAATCAERLHPRCRVLPSEYHLPRAAVVASIGQRQLLQGRQDDFWALVPVYLRPSAAEEKWMASAALPSASTGHDPSSGTGGSRPPQRV